MKKVGHGRAMRSVATMKRKYGLKSSKRSDFNPDYSRCVGVDLEKSLFHWGIAPGMWFRQVTYDVKLTNLQSLPPSSENPFKEQTRRLSS